VIPAVSLTAASATTFVPILRRDEPERESEIQFWTNYFAQGVAHGLKSESTDDPLPDAPILVGALSLDCDDILLGDDEP
jgi:hypothetical protein